MTFLTDPDLGLAFLSLTALEIVLGIDNIVFIAILADTLPKAKQRLAYRLGLAGALLTRLGLLLTLSWLMRLQKPLFHAFGQGLSGRDLILLAGGLFLIGKSTHEVYTKLETNEDAPDTNARERSLGMVVLQIMVLDIVFSLDSVITAVGMSNHIWIMVAAIVAAVIVMLIFAQPIGSFVNRHPSVKILALSFLLLIGVLLVADGLGQHVNKGYIYFAMGFSLIVELLNMRLRRNQRRESRLPPATS